MNDQRHQRRAFRSVKGTRDLLPPETGVWAAVEECARRVFGLYGYTEIRTPVVESTELFVRGVGEATDIVGKEMYVFDDRKGRSLALRPESTASVVRAFVQHGFKERGLPARLFYIGPHFRYERPQKGRYRQFHQIGAELIGDPAPHSDVEVIAMLVRFLNELGFENLVVQLNTVGDEASRDAFRRALVDFLAPQAAELSEESKRRLATNPLRILDTKSPAERNLLEGAPRLEEHLSPESREQFESVCGLLESLGIAFQVEPHLVRGLDYYSGTVFEIVAEGLGAQDAIVGGGRYDGLVAGLGGADLPGIGFAIGEDRLIEVLPEAFADRARPGASTIVLPIEPVPAEEAVKLAEEVRESGLTAVCELGGASVKAALRRAGRSGARFVLLLGEEELASGTVAVKDLASGEQTSIPRSEVGDLADRTTENGEDG